MCSVHRLGLLDGEPVSRSTSNQRHNKHYLGLAADHAVGLTCGLRVLVAPEIFRHMLWLSASSGQGCESTVG